MPPADRARYEQALALIRSGAAGAVERGLTILHGEVAARPGDATARFELAGALDELGREAEALEHYRGVYAAGPAALPEGDRPWLYVQMGSTLRNLGRLGDARALLAEGRARFPRHAAISVFLALTEISAGDHRAASALLLTTVLRGDRDASVERYRWAITRYGEAAFGDTLG